MKKLAVFGMSHRQEDKSFLIFFSMLLKLFSDLGVWPSGGLCSTLTDVLADYVVAQLCKL